MSLIERANISEMIGSDGTITMSTASSSLSRASYLPGRMNINSNYLLNNDCYFPQTTPKDMVLLHFTAGPTALPAIQTFSKPVVVPPSAANPKGEKYPVSTQYVVDKDGTIYKLFEEAYWSYHLGIQGSASENHRHDKRSVAIEIANVGPLRVRGDQLCYWPPITPQGLPAFKSPYCSMADSSRYVRLRTPYRGETYFAAFPAAQVEAVANLVDDICTRLKIPKILPPIDLRHKFDPAYYRAYDGVTSHVNWRADKTDLAPGQADPIWAALETRGFSEQTDPL